MPRTTTTRDDQKKRQLCRRTPAHVNASVVCDQLHLTPPRPSAGARRSHGETRHVEEGVKCLAPRKRRSSDAVRSPFLPVERPFRNDIERVKIRHFSESNNADISLSPCKARIMLTLHNATVWPALTCNQGHTRISIRASRVAF